MSSLGRWSYTNVATIWPDAGTDEWGQPTYGTPYTIDCTWADTGETQTDQDGSEFVPASTFWFESPYTSGGYTAYETMDGVYLTSDSGEYQVTADGVAATMPERSDRIAKFDRTDETLPPTDSQIIRKVTSYDMSMFGDEIPDWEVFT